MDLPITGQPNPFGKRMDQFDDKYLKQLKEKDKIKYLDLENTSITDEGMSVIGEMDKLEVLTITRTAVTDEGLRRLGKLTRLRTLFVEGTRVTGVGFEHLGGLKELAVVGLGRNHVAKEGLAALNRLSGLRVLYLEGATWDPGQVEELRRKPEGCQVYLHGQLQLWHSKPRAGELAGFRYTSPDVTDQFLLRKNPRDMERRSREIIRIGSHATVSSLEIIGKNKNINNLILEKVQGIETGKGHLRDLEHIQRLTLNGSELPEAIWKELGEMGQLRSLVLAGKIHSGKGLEPVAKLAELNALELHDTGAEDADLSVLEGIQSLMTVKINEKGITGSGFARWGRLNRLAELDLHHSGITDAGLVQLKPTGTLRSLNLKGTRITDKGLEHLKQFKGLMHLDLGDTQITDAGLGHLGSLQNLEGINLSGTQVTGKGLKILRGCNNLRVLELANCPLTDEAAEVFLEFDQIPTLNITGTQISRQGYRSIQAKWPNAQILPRVPSWPEGKNRLEEQEYVRSWDTGKKDPAELKIWLSDPERPRQGVGGAKASELSTLFKKLKGVRKLIIEDRLDPPALRDQDLEGLAGLHEVEELQLYSDGLTGDCLRYIGKMKGLKILRISETQVTDQRLVFLKDLPELVSVSLPDTVIGPGLATFAAMPKVRELRVAAGVRYEGLGYLENCKGLKKLHMQESGVTPVALTRLSALKELEDLAFPWGAIDAQTLDFLHPFPKLVNLNLGRHQIDAALAKKIDNFPNIRSLDLNGASFTWADLAPLKVLKNLEGLGLAKTQVGDDWVVHLKELRSLRSLDLKESQVTANGYLQLKMYLPKVDIDWVEPLNLERNGRRAWRGDAPNAVAITGVLYRLPGESKSISLSHWAYQTRNINKESINLLKQFKGLQHLDLEGIPLTDEELEPLRDLSLEYLGLLGTRAGKNGFPYLRGMQSLKQLGVGGPEMTQEGMVTLGKLKGLSHLVISDTRNVTADWIRPLQGLEKLEILNLLRTDTHDQELPAVAELKGLKDLGLARTLVTDAGLKHLAGMSKLTHLDLCRTKVTDAGLKHLVGMQGLKVLDLMGTDVTPAGVEALRKALPGCRILWEEGRGKDTASRF